MPRDDRYARDLAGFLIRSLVFLAPALLTQRAAADLAWWWQLPLSLAAGLAGVIVFLAVRSRRLDGSAQQVDQEAADDREAPTRTPGQGETVPMAYGLTFARTLALHPEAAYACVLHCDLRRVFDRRCLVLAPVASYTTDPRWGQVGGGRQVTATDGSTFTETLTSLEPGSRVEYTMTDIRGPLRMIARHVEVRWAFDPHPDGARVSWCWEITPPNRLSAALESFFRPQWSRYAGRALGRLEVVAVERSRSR